MIVFDVRCAQDHVFEAWFASGAAFDAQRAAGQVACPFCGATDVAKAVMAPAVAAKGNRRADPSPTTLRTALQALATAQARMLADSAWVGPRFAERARAMHDGTEAQATIHGQATLAEARDLAEDGVAIMPLLMPVVPPDAIN